jgi:hypothetical protein
MLAPGISTRVIEFTIGVLASLEFSVSHIQSDCLLARINTTAS